MDRNNWKILILSWFLVWKIFPARVKRWQDGFLGVKSASKKLNLVQCCLSAQEVSIAFNLSSIKTRTSS